eukprot:GHVT01024015.1.p4 GENE.GHVT01024015.1~~GHVT01024015.1.p4  ORF type:complete len:114 (-),score=3.17 GHVT01024015.1:87-428(-)
MRPVSKFLLFPRSTHSFPTARGMGLSGFTEIDWELALSSAALILAVRMHRKTRRQQTPNRTEEASDPTTAIGRFIKLRPKCLLPAFRMCRFAKGNDDIRRGKAPADGIAPSVD